MRSGKNPCGVGSVDVLSGVLSTEEVTLCSLEYQGSVGTAREALADRFVAKRPIPIPFLVVSSVRVERKTLSWIHGINAISSSELLLW